MSVAAVATRPRAGLLRDLNAEALSAGATTFLWYAFGAVPLQLAVAAELGLGPARTASWISIVWLTGAVASLALSLRYRQPIPITWSIPGLVYLGTVADDYGLAELVGANLVAGVAILALALLGVGGRIIAWVPLPIVLGMFAGSILKYVAGVIEATVADVAVAGSAVAGYALARALRRRRLPPLALAVAFGALAAVLTGRSGAGGSGIALAAPTLELVDVGFSAGAVVSVALPLVVLSLAVGNVQGLGFLLAQGYRVPVDRVSVALGLGSIVNALFGGHQSIVARTGAAIVAGREAGPPAGRYWASLVAASLTLVLALGAGLVASLLGVVPPVLVAAIAGLAVLTAFQDSVEKAFRGKLRLGAAAAFVVASLPFSVAGVTSAFWALLVGLALSLAAERPALLAFWRPAAQAAA